MKTYQNLKKLIVLLALLLFWPLLGNGQGNLVVNGGFDTDASGWTLTNGAFYTSVKGGIGGWVVLDVSSPSASTPDPTASQLVNGLVPGQTYDVSGNFQKYADWTLADGLGTGLSFGVAIDGNYLFESADPGNYLPDSFSFLYTAISSSAILSLASQMNGTGISYGIDNISMQLVPEPSAEMLLGFGGILFFGLRRLASFYSPMKCSAMRRECGRVRCSHK